MKGCFFSHMNRRPGPPWSATSQGHWYTDIGKDVCRVQIPAEAESATADCSESPSIWFEFCQGRTYNLSGQIIPTFLLAVCCASIQEGCFTGCFLLHFSPIVNYICSRNILRPLFKVQKLFPIFCCTGAAKRYTSKFRKLFSWILFSVPVSI